MLSFLHGVKIASLITALLSLFAFIGIFVDIKTAQKMDLREIEEKRIAKEQQETMKKNQRIENQERMRSIQQDIRNIKNKPSPALLYLGFSKIPEDKKELKKKYRALSKEKHPDSPTGNNKDFIELQKQYRIAEKDLESCLEIIKELESTLQ